MSQFSRSRIRQRCVMTVGRDIAMLVLVAAFASACNEQPTRSVTAPRTPSFIVNGTPTGPGSFGGVGALLFDFNHDGVLNGDAELCTGSLIAPEVFLTAAHCVVDPSTPP